MPLPSNPSALVLISQIVLPYGSGTGGCRVQFSWTAGAGATDYNIYQFMSGGWAPIATHVPGPNYAVYASPSENVQLRIQSSNSSGVSNGYSNELDALQPSSFDISGGTFSGPTGAAVSSITDTTASLTWTWAFDVLTSYQVTISPSGFVALNGGSTNTPPSLILATAAALSGLTPGTEYTVSIREVRDSPYGPITYSDRTTLTFTTTGSPPDSSSSSSGDGDGGSGMWDDGGGAIAGPSPLYLQKGGPAAGVYVVTTSDTIAAIDQWGFINGPAGITLAVVSSDATNKTVRLTGIVTQEGSFTPTFCIATDQGDYITFQIQIYVNSTLFLTWLNQDPSVLDLQIDIRSRQLQSYAATAPPFVTASADSTTLLTLRAGDTENLTLVFKDGANLLDPYAPDAVEFTARLTGFAGLEPLVAVTDDTITVTTIGGHSVFVLTVLVWSDFLQRLLAALDSQATANTGDLVFSGTGDIRWRVGGRWHTSNSFTVTILQPESA